MRGEKGFTLIELLVVVAIIGILSVIGIYQFAAYRGQAFCSSIEADVKDTVTAEEGYFAAYQTYGAAEVITTHGTVANVIASTLDAASTGTVTGSSTNCVRPDGTTSFVFTQSNGQYLWQ